MFENTTLRFQKLFFEIYMFWIFDTYLIQKQRNFVRKTLEILGVEQYVSRI
jgi:hypothetical protein